MLSRIAKELNFENSLYLSKGEKRSRGRARDLILANTLEALIGAIYLDKGLEKTRSFIEHNLITHLTSILENKLYLDPKSKFQEIAQEKTGITPSYKVLKEWGPDHEKEFTMGAYLDKKLVGKGSGPSKQIAEQSAAADALENYKF